MPIPKKIPVPVKKDAVVAPKPAAPAGRPVPKPAPKPVVVEEVEATEEDVDTIEDTEVEAVEEDAAEEVVVVAAPKKSPGRPKSVVAPAAAPVAPKAVKPAPKAPAAPKAVKPAPKAPAAPKAGGLKLGAPKATPSFVVNEGGRTTRDTFDQVVYDAFVAANLAPESKKQISDIIKIVEECLISVTNKSSLKFGGTMHKRRYIKHRVYKLSTTEHHTLVPGHWRVSSNRYVDPSFQDKTAMITGTFDEDTNTFYPLDETIPPIVLDDEATEAAANQE